MLTLATLMWAGHTIAARLSVGEMSPMVMMGLRWFSCLAILIVIFREAHPGGMAAGSRTLLAGLP